MWGVISSIISLWGNPIVQLLLKTAIKIVKAVPPDVSGFVISAVSAAAQNPDLIDGTMKRNWVLAKVKAEYPGIGESVVRWLIQTSLDARES